MKTDQNPSVVCALFCTQKAKKDFFKLVDNRNGMRVREMILVDISIPLDDTFDDNINFLKHGSMPILKRFVETELPFNIRKKLFEKMNLKPFDYSKLWDFDLSNRLLYCGITPIAVDDKYIESGEYTDDEKDKCKRLLSFDTPDYKPDKSQIAKNQEDVGDIPKEWLK